MKIAIIGSKGIPAASGGIERYVDELSVRLVKLGHQVLVYCRGWYTNRQRYQGVKLVYRPSIRTKNLDTISHTWFSLWDALYHQKVDLIHVQGVGPSLLVWVVKILRPSIKVVVTFHCRDSLHQKWGVLARLFLRWGEALAVRLPQATIAVSKTLQDYCSKHWSGLVYYIPNGIKTMPQTQKTKADVLAKFNLRSGYYLLTVCRLVPHKGVHYLIQAFNLIDNHRFKLVIVGDSSYTDKYVAQLKTLAKDNPRIIFTGALDYKDLASLYQNAFLYIQASETEGLSLSLLEAQSFGCSALVSDIEENKEAIGQNGFTFKSTNISDLAKKISYLLSQRSLVRDTGVKAKLRVRQEYDWNKIARQTAKLYEIVMSKEKSKK